MCDALVADASLCPCHEAPLPLNQIMADGVIQAERTSIPVAAIQKLMLDML